MLIILNIWFFCRKIFPVTRQPPCSTHLSYPRISLREDPLPPFLPCATDSTSFFQPLTKDHFKLSKIISSDFPALLIFPQFHLGIFFSFSKSLLHFKGGKKKSFRKAKLSLGSIFASTEQQRGWNSSPYLKARPKSRKLALNM